MVNLDRANDALTATTDLDQAGAVFNDATRLLDGGLWNNPVDNNGQKNYLDSFNADIHAVQNDITSGLANGITVAGVAFTPTAAETAILTHVNGQLNTLLAAAPNSIGVGGAAAQATLHTTQTAILNEINGDAGLAAALGNAAYAANTGANDNPFQALGTPASDNAAALKAAVAPGATLADVGTVFNAMANVEVGGINIKNFGEVTVDTATVAIGLQHILNNPASLAAITNGEAPQDAALTTIHLQTLENQIQGQPTFNIQAITNPTVGARGTNDNILDMIDIVQNDANLNMAAGGNGMPGHTGGFAEQPGFLTGTVTQFVDSQGQTNFWSQFLSEANVINGQLQNVAANGTTPAAAHALVTELQNYNTFGATFAAGQGGVFSARFNNELTQGTLKADTTAAVQGLTGIANHDTGANLVHDQAQILAAGQGYVADAMDVSGNNLPAGGQNYVGTATTVATATNPNNIAMGTIPVTGAANPNTGLAIGHGSGSDSHTVADYSHMWHHA